MKKCKYYVIVSLHPQCTPVLGLMLTGLKAKITAASAASSSSFYGLALDECPSGTGEDEYIHNRKGLEFFKKPVSHLSAEVEDI